MSKIGFIIIAHPDYIIDGNALRFAREAQDNLRNSGIEVILARCIAVSIRDARAAGDEMTKSGVDGIIFFFGSWFECSTAMAAVRETEHIPLCIWAFPMWEENGNEMSTGSYVSYAMFKGVLDRIKRTYRGILGMPGDNKSVKQAVSFCRAASAYQKLKRSRIGLVGYTSMSIYTGTFDHVFMRTMIGPETEHIDSYSLIRLAKSMGEDELKKVCRSINEVSAIHPAVRESSLMKAASLYLAIEALKSKYDLDAINVKCQYEFSKEYGMTMCIPLSLAASERFVTSCEGDMLCTVSMMILQYLTGQVIAYGDAINHKNGILKMSPCGFMPYQLSGGDCLIQNFMEGVGFTGLQNSFTMKHGKVTLLRLVEDIGSYHLLCCTGEGLASTKLRQGYFPALDIELDGDINELVSHYSGQHFAICYGNLSDEIKVLGKILKTDVICI
ncbi:MAG: hypothetical protein ACYCWE_04400 [Eubacteriales bacterium]